MSEEKEKNISRRDFLKTSGIATGTLIGGGLIGGFIGYGINKQTAPKKVEEIHNVTSPKGRMFFTKELDFNILSKATERIFPKDDLGPGAIELGVPYFIDNQLAGNYGSNAREYMQGPHFIGAPTQGYQASLTRADAYRQGIAALDKEAHARFNKSFVDLEGGQMDEILTAFEKGEVKMTGITSDFFFRMLRSATIQGVYADPIYSGNNNMDGWRMKDFPGNQMSYLNVIDSKKFQKIEPLSLANMEH
ncbi:gluconate 2-dehydrogenase subunit 3 family protein [Bacillus sp. S/N-304-OC-R1]|uniref:gluconate 2-dehydrogenase subunit 3 family protein n=1 Tax=Bacillus sp. S/N-304-OC-R1 TaxID=2758034 RepID=UPI001C8CFA21|nr:gluconate 2-dehydrogenase subunit 3 family protein [Bacillus sp. S/N-304-OC-R1]MBY0123047.1 gluconate 2-dehydrogenase subunit 3 family protein [Bacillus sp. S/N-304-OC-R1]